MDCEFLLFLHTGRQFLHVTLKHRNLAEINEVYVISLKNAECMSIIVKYQLTPPGVQNSSNSQSILRILGMLSTDTSEIH